jgi:glycosyltransferase involved in cell wall biosynthesis
VRASVIVPAYRRTEELERALRSVLAQDFDPREYEVVVVDSSPDDRNQALVESLIATAPCSLRCLRKNPEGPGPSRNLGAWSSSGPILAFLDSDCDASPQWLRSGVEAFEAGVGLVQGRTIPDPAVPAHVLNIYIDVQSENFIYESANVFYRREAFEQAGGFEPDRRPDSLFPAGGEDVLLAWKVKRAGWQSRFANDALVVHPVRRMTWKQWVIPQTMEVFPFCAKACPEIRAFFYLRYFLDDAQALLTLGVFGLALAFWTRWSLLLFLPYLILRGGKRSNTLPGPLRVLRILLYFPRDAASFAILVASSARAGTLLL